MAGFCVESIECMIVHGNRKTEVAIQGLKPYYKERARNLIIHSCTGRCEGNLDSHHIEKILNSNALLPYF